jgi:C-terminal processing protease CtpA/Prc
MRSKNILILSLICFCLVIRGAAHTNAQGSDEQTPPAANVVNDQGGPRFISGQANYTFPYFRTFLPQPYIILYDVAGLVERDVDFYPSQQSQVFGTITTDPFTSPFTYELPLPLTPRGELRDVDNDGINDVGVMIFAVTAVSNTWADPFLEERDNFIAGVLQSVVISSDVDSFLEIERGSLLIYAPDDAQGFPSGFGPDGKLFTADDPIVLLPQGYTVVNLNSDPFTFDRSAKPLVDLVEAEDAELDDFSDQTYVQAFDSMIDLLSRQYAFTEYKGIDWDALSAQFRPRIEEAERNNDRAAYRRALRDLAWSIPDGHVSGPVEIEDFQREAVGGLGFALRELDDARVIVTFLSPNGAAQRAGVLPRAEILAINDTPIQQALDATIPWTSPFSTDHNRRLEQLRFVHRAPIDTPMRLTFRNPGEAERTVDLTTQFDPESYTAAALNQPLEGTELPVEFRMLENGYGYLAMYSFSDDLPLTVSLWERAIAFLVGNDVPGLIIDMRQNGGGSGYLGDQLPAYFFDDEYMIGNSARYSEARDEFVVNEQTEDNFVVPTNGLIYDGPIAVLISPNCASACEGFTYAMTVNDRAAIVGQYPTAGLGGSVVPIALPDDTRFSYTNTRSLGTEGEINIEGLGIAPTIRVPVTEETLFAENDVILDAALSHLDQQTRGFGSSDGGPVELDQTVDGALTLGQRVRYTLDVAQGEGFSIYAYGTGDNPPPIILRIYVPGVDEPGFETGPNAGPGDDTAVEQLQARQAITLILEIATQDDAGSGDYQLRLIREN